MAKNTSKNPSKSAGPYTPIVTPVNTGQKSGGEWNWEHASATPPKR